MKKVFLLLALIVSINISAQEGFRAGAHIGLPVGLAGDFSGFNFGFDLSYMFEVDDQLEVGPLTGYTHFTGKTVAGFFGSFKTSGSSAIPLAGVAQYNISDQFFGSFGLGIGIPTNGGDVGLFYKPEFGYKTDFFDISLFFRGIGKGGSSIGLGFAYKFDN